MIEQFPRPIPEQQNNLEYTQDRIKRATEMFEKHFDEAGRPITKKGRDMSRIYGYSYWEEYPYTINGVMKWFRKLKKALKSERTKTLERQIEDLNDMIVMLLRKIIDLEDVIYVEDDE